MGILLSFLTFYWQKDQSVSLRNTISRLMIDGENQPRTVKVSFWLLGRCVFFFGDSSGIFTTCSCACLYWSCAASTVLPCSSVTGHHLVSWAIAAGCSVAAHQLPVVERGESERERERERGAGSRAYLRFGSVSYWPSLINPSEWHWHNSA